MGLLSTIFLHPGAGVRLRFDHRETAQRRGLWPIFLAPGAGIRRVVGAGGIAGRSHHRSALGGRNGYP